VQFLSIFLVKRLNDLLLDYLVALEKQGLDIKTVLTQNVVNILFIGHSCVALTRIGQYLRKELLLLVFSLQDFFF
jgi:hypothetical protein